jgi:aspartate racemase
MSNRPLQTIAVLGGMSSESTREYYRMIDEEINAALGGHHAGDIVIRSVNFADIEEFISTDDWATAGEYLATAARDLEAAGADVVVVATNTMHRVADAIDASLSIPFIHIVDPTADAIAADGLDSVGVLGTEAVMGGDFYAERFADHDIDVLVPDAEAQTIVDDIIFEELVHGVIEADSRERYLQIIDDLVDRGAEGIVLGCTEIELLVDQSDRPAVPMFDTTALHVARAVEYALGEAPHPA